MNLHKTIAKKLILLASIGLIFIGCDSSTSVLPKPPTQTVENKVEPEVKSTEPTRTNQEPEKTADYSNSNSFMNEAIALEILNDKISISSEGSNWDKVIKVPIRNNLKHLTVSQIEILNIPSTMYMIRNEPCPQYRKTIQVNIPPGRTKTVVVSPQVVTGCDYEHPRMIYITKVKFSNGDFFEDGDLIPDFFNHQIREADKN